MSDLNEDRELEGGGEATLEDEDDGYGRCAGCGGLEPTEILAQLDGYCSSSCERDHRDDWSSNGNT